MRLATVITTLLLLVLGPGCGGSDGGSGSDGGPSLSLSFTPDEDNPGNNTVTLAPQSSSGGMSAIAVNVTDTNGIFSTALEITFDPTVAEFVGDSPGNLLESSATPIYLVSSPSEANQNGRIVIGVSLPNGASDTDVTGAATLIVLTFEAVQAGGTALAFENQALHDSQTPPQDLPGIAWYGGSLVAI